MEGRPKSLRKRVKAELSLSPYHISHGLVLMGAQAKGWEAERAAQPGTFFCISERLESQGGLQWLSAASWSRLQLPLGEPWNRVL